MLGQDGTLVFECVRKSSCAINAAQDRGKRGGLETATGVVSNLCIFRIVVIVFQREEIDGLQ